ncbi:Smr/MutS family protein [Geothrix sp. 21YS21S-2]|uniref:Smr/MutS family protein n=1 Tax=Geothrix sp. 21YS21S-2 TaxID=3068893 RepID=UPI0027BA6BFB|nr:Smr/MutS family protein [Geothrix sp. 21YS21S-2]
MVWKKDLEKLKKSLAEDPAPPKAPPPKPKPTEFKPMEEEDAVFLSAMGKRPKAAPSITAPAAPAPAAPPAPAEPGLDFASAMGELKGMVALPATQLAPKPAPRPEPKPEPPPVKLPAPPPALKVPEPLETPLPEPPPAQPVQINLAAGMAIDVDGTLDLKGHGRNDAEERLKERILDGHALGWRTLHVVLGPAEDLRSMFLELVGRSGRIARYAQAPIPMGGSQAWIIYFRGPGAAPEAN